MSFREHKDAYARTQSPGRDTGMAMENKKNPDKITRRQFITRVAGTTAAAGALAAGGYLIYDEFNPVRPISKKTLDPRSFLVPAGSGAPRNVMVKGADPIKNLHAALEKLGSIETFVKKGDRVLLKPNMGWDRTPELAANTNPVVVEEMARLCLKAGARSVIVADHSVNDGARCARNSGIRKAAEKTGAKLVLVGKDSDFVEARVQGKVLKTWPMMKLLYEVDKVVNMPAAKHHSLSRVTLGIKNWIGVAGGRRRKLHQNIHQTIVDLIAAFPPTLTVIDASRLMMKHGPTGGRLSDVKTSEFLAAGVEPASVDAAVLPLLDAQVSEVMHVSEAVSRGLGSTHKEAVFRFTAGT